ncbi:MAG TPA: NAD(P)H-quinone oxidoreductase [Polyangiaceae bacterium]|nr:NAD(P)H-quinone oxidoreductase [Polyangiaceae bacterium]
MRTIVVSRFGGPEVLTLVERARPEPSRGEVRVRVRAAGVNRADIVQRLGRYPAPSEAPSDVLGLEFAGEVEALGPGVTTWKVGDRVFGLVGGGAYAEALLTHERLLAAMPPGMSFSDAAAAPEAFITAYDAMTLQGKLALGETVLIHAAGSGVGTAAIQLAKVSGARSIGTARSAGKLDRARELGLDHGIVVTGPSFAGEVARLTSGRGAHVVLELVGGEYLREDVGCVAHEGRIILVGLMAGVSVTLDLGAILRQRVLLRGTMLRSRPLEQKLDAMQAFARHVVPLLASGALRSVVDRVLPLADAAAAHTYVEQNQSFGKVILDCG